MLKKIHRLMLIALVALVGASNAPTPAQRKAEPDLHTRAKRAGGTLVWRYKPTRSVIYPNLEELAKRSDIVMIGRTLGHRSSITPNGRFITQDFLVRVQQVFKGDVSNGKSMLVSLPGGSYKFKDGTHVYVMAHGYKQPEDGASYVFFLSKDSSYKGHRLASEIQGLFALKDGRVEPASAVPSDPIFMRYQGMGAVDFLQRLHAALPVGKR